MPIRMSRRLNFSRAAKNAASSRGDGLAGRRGRPPRRSRAPRFRSSRWPIPADNCSGGRSATSRSWSAPPCYVRLLLRMASSVVLVPDEDLLYVAPSENGIAVGADGEGDGLCTGCLCQHQGTCGGVVDVALPDGFGDLGKDVADGSWQMSTRSTKSRASVSAAVMMPSLSARSRSFIRGSMFRWVEKMVASMPVCRRMGRRARLTAWSL